MCAAARSAPGCGRSAVTRGMCEQELGMVFRMGMVRPDLRCYLVEVSAAAYMNNGMAVLLQQGASAGELNAVACKLVEALRLTVTAHGRCVRIHNNDVVPGFHYTSAQVNGI